MMNSHEFFLNAASQRKRELVCLAIGGEHGLAELVAPAPVKTDTRLPLQEKPAKCSYGTRNYLDQ